MTLEGAITGETGKTLVSTADRALWNAKSVTENPKGVWNAATNTPDAVAMLTANGDTLDVTTAGTSSVTGESLTYAVGDKLKKTAAGLVRIPVVVTPSTGSITETQLAATVAAKLPSSDYNSTIAYAIIDQQGRLAFYVDAAGRLCTPQVGDVSAAIQAVQAITPYAWPDESGYAWGITDSTGKIAFGLDKTGSLVIKGQTFASLINALVSAGLITQTASLQSAINQNATSIQALQASVPVSWPDESGYTWGVADSAGKIAFGLDKTGALVVKGQPLATLINVLVSAGSAAQSASIQAQIDLLKGYTVEWPDQSGYVWGVVDSAGKIAFGLDRAGNLIYKGQALTSLLNGDLQAQFNAISPYVTPTQNIRCIGDSLTAASYPAKLAAKFSDGRTVTNGGVGGDTSTQIAFRHGAISVAAQIAGGQLPASGSVAATPTNVNILQNGRSVTAHIANIQGTFARDSSGNYSFTRTTAGSVVILDKTIMVNPITTPWDTSIAIIWMGRNNYTDTATVLSDIAAVVATLKSVRKRFIVMSVLNGNYGGESIGGNNYNIMIGLNAAIRATYPRNFIDIRERLVRSYDPAIAQDVTDFNNDVVPSSLRVDNVHLTDTANETIVAQEVYNFITARGW